MRVSKISGVVPFLAALAVGCGGSEDGGNDAPIDAGSLMDAQVDSGSTGDAGFACTSYTPPTATMCGGSSCLQTPAQLREKTPKTATCGTDKEVERFCDLTAVTIVKGCTVSAVLMNNEAYAKTCAESSLPDISPNCLTCYLASAKCAADHCAAECLTPDTSACDLCRYNNHCFDTFYACSGFVDPLPPPP